MLSVLARAFRVATRTDMPGGRLVLPSRDWPTVGWRPDSRPEWPAPLHWYQRPCEWRD